MTASDAARFIPVVWEARDPVERAQFDHRPGRYGRSAVRLRMHVSCAPTDRFGAWRWRGHVDWADRASRVGSER
ncbi:hypothetical protein GCM10018777_66010 [Streptomyces albogriseolus]|nr:hypothetical protein GCM10018777_66010 [Streptomyces viridodiastaticus]